MSFASLSCCFMDWKRSFRTTAFRAFNGTNGEYSKRIFLAFRCRFETRRQNIIKSANISIIKALFRHASTPSIFLRPKFSVKTFLGHINRSSSSRLRTPKDEKKEAVTICPAFPPLPVCDATQKHKCGYIRMNKSSGAGQTRSNFYNSHDDAEIFLYHKKEKRGRSRRQQHQQQHSAQLLWCLGREKKFVFQLHLSLVELFPRHDPSEKSDEEVCHATFIFSCCIIGKSNCHAELEEKSFC